MTRPLHAANPNTQRQGHDRVAYCGAVINGPSSDLSWVWWLPGFQPLDPKDRADYSPTCEGCQAAMVEAVLAWERPT